MNFRPSIIPDASDVGLEILNLRQETLQWQIYDARRGDQSVCSWRFWPTYLQQDQVGWATWARVRATAAPKRAVAFGYRPLEAVYSIKAASGWLIYPQALQVRPTDLTIQGRCLQVAYELAAALYQCHQVGALNLDVHPDNLYSVGNRIRLAGFGIDLRVQTRQRAAQQRSNEGLARGHYGAPEQWDVSGRSPLGPWTDIFGAAATIFFCLTGKPPPDFRDRIANPLWRVDLARDLAPSLDKLGEDAAGIERMILTGLEPRIAARPRSVAEWVENCGLSLPQETSASDLQSGSMDAQQTTIEGQTIPPGMAGDDTAEPRKKSCLLIVLPLTLAGIAGALYLQSGGEQQPSEGTANADQEPQMELKESVDLNAQSSAAAQDDQEIIAREDAGADVALDSAIAEAEDDESDEDGNAARSGEAMEDVSPRTASRTDPPALVNPPKPPPRKSAIEIAPELSRIVQRPSLRSGSIGLADFPAPASGRQIRFGTSVQVEFTVNTDGRPANCSLTRFGPDPATNARLCELVLLRLRFNPARDQFGKPVVGQYGWRQDFFGPR